MYQTNKYNRLEEFKLDNEDDGSCNHTFILDNMSNANVEGSIYIKEANEIVSRFEGKCLSLKCCDDRAPLKLV